MMPAGRSAAVIIAVTAVVGLLVFAAAGQAVAATGGTWQAAQKVPGTGTLNKGGNAEVNSVSCRSAGNCTAGRSYKDGSGRYQAFVASEVNGIWHTAIEVPGTAALNAGGNAWIGSV